MACGQADWGLGGKRRELLAVQLLSVELSELSKRPANPSKSGNDHFDLHPRPKPIKTDAFPLPLPSGHTRSMDEGTAKTPTRRTWSVFRQRTNTPGWWKILRWSRISFVQDIAFRIASLVEAAVILLTLCFFYLCCGCNF